MVYSNSIADRGAAACALAAIFCAMNVVLPKIAQ